MIAPPSQYIFIFHRVGRCLRHLPVSNLFVTACPDRSMHILFPVRHPFEQGQADEFRAVVAAQVTRRPRTLIRRARTSITLADRIEPATSMASASRVCSSTTVRHLICWPAFGTGDWKMQLFGEPPVVSNSRMARCS
jgi:hypothetical protein